jgi:hypothetical protein
MKLNVINVDYKPINMCKSGGLSRGEFVDGTTKVTKRKEMSDEIENK